MMYRITYEQGNGYGCSCCRRTETLTEDFEEARHVLLWLIELEADKKRPKLAKDDGEDRKVISIERMEPVDVLPFMMEQVTPGLVEVEIERRKAKDIERQRQLGKEYAERLERRQREQYEKLKAIYDNPLMALSNPDKEV